MMTLKQLKLIATVIPIAVIVVIELTRTWIIQERLEHRNRELLALHTAGPDVGSLFLLFSADPCVAVIPMQAPSSWSSARWCPCWGFDGRAGR